jgi:hypothetical protein
LEIFVLIVIRLIPFDIPHTNAMREYMDNPEAKKMAQESGIKFETLFGVTCKD